MSIRAWCLAIWVWAWQGGIFGLRNCDEWWELVGIALPNEPLNPFTNHIPAK